MTKVCWDSQTLAFHVHALLGGMNYLVPIGNIYNNFYFINSP